MDTDWSELTATQSQINKELMKREVERVKFEYERQQMRSMMQKYQDKIASLQRPQSNSHSHSMPQGFSGYYDRESLAYSGYERPVNYDVSLYDLLRKTHGL